MKSKHLLKICCLWVVLFVSQTTTANNWGSYSMEVGDEKSLYLSDATESLLGRSSVTVLSYNWESESSCVAVTYQSLEFCNIKALYSTEDRWVEVKFTCRYRVGGREESMQHYYDIKVNGDPEPERVTLSPEAETIFVGDKVTFTPSLIPTNAKTTYLWESGNKKVATVSSSGEVTGVSEGVAAIMVTTANGKSAISTITVKNKPVQPTNISLPSTLSLTKSEQRTLTPTITPSNATTALTWESDNTDVATVSQNGVVTGIKEGTAVITAKTDNGLSASCTVTVKIVVPTSISFFSGSETISNHGTTTRTPIITPSNATTTLTWRSDDETIARVSQDGQVTGVGVGTTTIRVQTDNGLTASYSVTVKPVPPTSISFSSESVTTPWQSTTILTPIIDPYYATTTLTWRSDDKAIAKVSQNGQVTGVGEGTTTITVQTDNDLTATCTVTVKIVPPTSISFPSDKITMKWQGTTTLTPIIAPDDATTTLTWRSDDKAIATVSQDGVVTEKEVGTATITVETYNGLSATCEVVVEPWADGTVFSALTDEGTKMMFEVISGKDRTCAVASGQVIPYTDCDITIPSNTKGFDVVRLNDGAFRNNNIIKSVIIPENVVSIGEKAFYGCDRLTSVTIPESVVSIGSINVFRDT